MKTHEVVWRPRAQDDLLALYDWIADRADPDTALAYTSGIEAHAAKLATFPERGTPRDDLMPGLRTTPYRRATLLAYRVVEGNVEILRVIQAAQDWDGRGEEE